jgi:hypothetical protein
MILGRDDEEHVFVNERQLHHKWAFTLSMCFTFVPLRAVLRNGYIRFSVDQRPDRQQPSNAGRLSDDSESGSNSGHGSAHR